MKKLFCIVLSALLLLSLAACNAIPTPESLAPAASDLPEATLIAAVKKNLGVPDTAGITYTISEKYYWDAAERYYVDVMFKEYGIQVAAACVDPTSGELLRNISNYTIPESTPVRDAFIDVLNSRRTFAVKSHSSGKVEQRKLSQFTFGTDASAMNVFVPAQYTFVDMDGDSALEVVILDQKMDFFLVLRYSGGNVFGYMVPYRGMMHLRIDGRFWSSGGASLSAIGRMSFDGLDYIVTELAYRDQYDGVYRLDGGASDKESVEAYYAKWEKMPEVEWIPFSS